ncbi:PefC/AfrB family outer membrane usher protein [Enterobacter asburiae]|nr:PefC/AfrB family outer membrane usher protein [Enterobacter asburiae]
MCHRIIVKYISLFETLVLLSFFNWNANATEFNMAFAKGVEEVPSVLKSDVKYPAGQYYVDVLLNGVFLRRMQLVVSRNNERDNLLCLDNEWLQSAGVWFQKDAYEETFDVTKDCYALERKESTHLNLDMSAQTLDIIIPQAWLLEKNDAARWDYGINGLRIRYDGNFNKNVQSNSGDDEFNAFVNLDTGLNIGRWVLSSDMNINRNVTGNKFSTNNFVLSTAISQVQGDLFLGYSQSRTELFTDFGFYGVSLRSNRNMRALRTRGYAPTITGIATGTSRITVNQGGYTIYSRVVPPGPWRLDDIASTGNGDLMVTVEDEVGRKTVTEYPVATLPSLLRSGDHEYNLALGERNKSNTLDDAFSREEGAFVLASFDWGLPTTTLNMAAILHGQYQSGGIGITQPLGGWGALALSVNGSRADYNDGSRREGMSSSVKYSKSFSGKTDLQLMAYRYQSQGYTEFADWDPKRTNIELFNDPHDSEYETKYIWSDGREKARYESRLSHRLDGVFLSGSFWQQTYWDRNKSTHGANISASTTMASGISLTLSGNWSQSAWYAEDDYSTALGISIPFSLGDIRHYSSNTIGYSRYSGINFNNTTSATVNERLNYNLNVGTDEKRNDTIGVSASYAFDRIQTNMALSQSRYATTLSGNVSGSAIATAKTDLLLTKESAETIAVLKIKDIPGVTFNNSLPTNNNGNTVMYLSEYHPTTININPENVPDSAELLTTSYEVVPTEKAIIYREFDFEQVKRYILQVKDIHGKLLAGGTARTEQGLDVGFVNRNGVLLMNLIATPQKILISQSERECSINMAGLKDGINLVQETHCE